ncbi:MAG: penicillin-binding protein 2 [Kiritimatiellia bacterium]
MSSDDRQPGFVSRASCLALAAVFAVGLLHLGVRLRELQVEEAADYGYASVRQSVRRVQVGGRRGRILDRRGRVLADNRTALSVVCLPAQFQARTWEGTVDRIEQAIAVAAETVGRPSPLTRQAIRRHVSQTLAMPLFVWRDVGEDEVARLAEHADVLPGFEVVETDERTYPQGPVAAHLLGYVGRDRGEGEAGDVKYSFFAPELRGRAGLEHYYDSFLRGVSGERKLLVDARGFAIREWTVVEAKQGPDLVLALDLEVQQECVRQLQGLRGACVVLDPRTGEVLALASAPGFDPNDFVPTLGRELYERYASDPQKPLLNRACGGAYAPGSTFKPVVALAGLEAGCSPSAAYDCTGVFALGLMHLRCASRWGHGPLDMRHALMKSCNPYFCHLGLEIGTNAICRAARAFGLGARTGIDFGVDMAGTVPDAEWKRRMYGEKWFQGDVAQMSIGQGMLLVSPLQMALVAGAIGTGYRVTPQLKAGLEHRRTPLPFSPAQLAVVREGMRMVVAGDDGARGSGWRGGDGVAVPVSGKTGTAEVGRGATRRKNTWFIAYAPADRPTVAVALVVENGESGGSTAAPKVGAILRRVFGPAPDRREGARS